MSFVRLVHSLRLALPTLVLALEALFACSSNDSPRSESPPAVSGMGALGADLPVGGRSGAGTQPESGGRSSIAGASGASSSAGNGDGASAGSAGRAGSANDAGGTGRGGSANNAAGASNAAGGSNTAGASSYEQAVLADQPVAFWAMNRAPMKETDLTGNGHDGSYRGSGTPGAAELPNGELGATFDGAQQYLTVPSSAVFSIPTTGTLTWEAWLRPDVLQFPNDDGVSGYVDWLGKCENYSPTCEWEARMYDTNTNESPNRPNRLSAYAFNPGAGLGSAADWQPTAGLIMAGAWYHVVGSYTTLSQPADCQNTAQSPGSIDIWVNGVKWQHSSHGQTGCMSQYDVVPKANDSALNIATMARESFFKGAIAKVAIYGHALDQAKINNHYWLMTGKQPTGSCAASCSF